MESNLHLGIAAFSATSFIMMNMSHMKRNKKPKPKRQISSSDSSGVYLYPPLPVEVIAILRSTKLCFLATVSNNEPHLSLMNFTYEATNDVFIFCSRKNTKKYQQLLSCANVSILLHDFPHLEDHESTKCGNNLSITLSGVAECLDDDNESSLFYRTQHLQNNPQYAQFIRKSEDIENSPGVVIVKVDRVRMCNILDQVKFWSK